MNVARDIIKVTYMSTEDQLADMLTKALGTKLLSRRRLEMYSYASKVTVFVTS